MTTTLDRPTPPVDLRKFDWAVIFTGTRMGGDADLRISGRTVHATKDTVTIAAESITGCKTGIDYIAHFPHLRGQRFSYPRELATLWRSA